MKSRIFLCALLGGILALGQEKQATDSTVIELEITEIIQKLPVTSEKITKKQLNEKNLGQDVPTLLQNATSVTTTTDAGAGIGYSSIRIRGITQNHINITMNGVPLNDPESQGVYWVNMPDLASNSSSVLIQRGVGTSTSGTGAFGAIVNIDSNQPSVDSFIETANSWGSFNTQKYSLQGGTGAILNGKLRIDLNASLIKSDGYIDRASSDLYSYGINSTYKLNEDTSFRLWSFFGKEKTYQSWNGIDKETMNNDRTFNSAGAIYNEDWTKITGYFDNETDNYQQHHNHLIWDQNYGNGWKSNTTFYYTRGKGYYENYIQGDDLIEYKIEENVGSADLIRQKWLDNHFYGVNFNLENQIIGNLKFFSGVSANQFKNEHYGIVKWIKGFENKYKDWEYYRNESEKTDLSVYAKALYSFDKFELFGDLQFRYVFYETKPVAGGENEFDEFFPFEDNFHFFNPKVGFNFYADQQNIIYAYYGMAHREPTRSDYMDNGKMLLPEELHDFEIGYKKSGRFNLTANVYYMYYLNQLVATGQLNDVGGYIRTNSGKSFRSGIELNADYQILLTKLSVFGNITYSINKNMDYSEVAYNDDWSEYLIEYGDTDLSFSPNWIGALGVRFNPIQNLGFTLTNKYVGEQFLTNTELSDGKLESYFLTDFILNFSPNWKKVKNLEFTILVNNLLNVEYESNGYYYEGAYYYPQAGMNFLAGFKLRI